MLNNAKKLSLLCLLLLPFSPLAQTAKPKAALISFENISARAGINFILNNSSTPEKHQIETMMAGVAVFDFDNDGWLGIYFANGARLPDFDKSDAKFHNKLYRNNHDGTFTDVSEISGIAAQIGKGMGVAFADYNGDGFTDIFVANDSECQLMMARVNIELGDKQQAVDLINRGLQKHNDDPHFLKDVARMLIETSRNQTQTAEVVQRVANSLPQDAEAQYLQAEWAFANSRLDICQEALVRTFQNRPDEYIRMKGGFLLGQMEERQDQMRWH